MINWIAIESIATIALAMGTFVLALFTYCVARTTSQLGDATLGSARLADRHHQEALLPCVVFDDICVDHSGDPSIVLVKGLLKNIGGGYALKVRLNVQVLSKQQVFFPGSLRSNYEYQWQDKVIVDRQASLPLTPAYRIEVWYESMFGTKGKAIYEGSGGKALPLERIERAPPDERQLPELLSLARTQKHRSALGAQKT
jgi:hypothetical protein